MSFAASSNRQSGALDPGDAWTFVTDAPLKGISLAREGGNLIAWDESDHLYLLDATGEFLAKERMPGKIQSTRISDDGTLVAVLGSGSKLWLLGPELEFIEDKSAITDATALCVDPFGRYVAVASKMNLVQFYSKYGRQLGRMETRQPLAGLEFVPDRLAMIGIGSFSMLMGFELMPEGDSGKLSGELVWTQNLLSSVGRMSITGDGGAIFVSCYTHGVQRFDGNGKTEGSYHLGGSTTIAVPDFAGRLIAVTSMEGELSLLSGSGNLKKQLKLKGPAVGLEVDALGRYVIHGLPTGEITKVDLYAGPNTSAAVRGKTSAKGQSAGVATKSASGNVRTPDWAYEVVNTEDQAEYTVLGVLDDPPRAAAIGPTNELELFTSKGKRLGKAPKIGGVGRIIRTSPGWIAAATDRQIVLCDCRKNTGQLLDLRLVEITHLAIRPDDFGLAIVQERDRIGRATPSGRWIWKEELRQPVEEIAIGPDGYFGLTLEDGTLQIHDAGGNKVEGYHPRGAEPTSLLAAPLGSPNRIVWTTLARRSQVIRGHDLEGRVIWESPVPFEAWQFHPAGSMVVVTAADGRSIAYDGAGHARAQSRELGPLDQYAAGPNGGPIRISRQGVHLICAEMNGQVLWRSIGGSNYGSMAVGASGVAVMSGKQMLFFGITPQNQPD